MTDYSRKGHYYIDEPRREVLKAVELIEGGATVLDVGAGYGNNTKFLLSQGYSVTALETNPEAVNRLRELQEAYPGRLRIVEESIDTFRPKESYDAIICCMVLHFLEGRETASQVIENMQSWTEPGGVNLITSYLDTNSIDDEYSFLLKSNELRELYAAWGIVWYEESYARTFKNVSSIKDLLRLARGQRGYKAARTVATKLNK